MAAAERALRQETGDDREVQEREATAATVAGAWLRNFAGRVQGELDAVERALDRIGFDPDRAPIRSRPRLRTRASTRSWP